MKVLVVFDLIPEETKRAIVNMTKDEYDYFKQAHNFIVNVSDGEENPNSEEVVGVINNAFSTNLEYIKYCETDKAREYFGKWTSDLKNVDLTDVEHMICCGFWL